MSTQKRFFLFLAISIIVSHIYGMDNEVYLTTPDRPLTWSEKLTQIKKKTCKQLSNTYKFFKAQCTKKRLAIVAAGVGFCFILWSIKKRCARSSNNSQPRLEITQVYNALEDRWETVQVQEMVENP